MMEKWYRDVNIVIYEGEEGIARTDSDSELTTHGNEYRGGLGEIQECVRRRKKGPGIEEFYVCG
jgi:hypothetical protein